MSSHLNQRHNWWMVLILFSTLFAFKQLLKGPETPVPHSQIESSFNPVEYPPKVQFRTYHRSNYEPTPFLADFLSTAQYLLYNTNASFIRFGDGEILLIHNRDSGAQRRDARLARALLEILGSNDPDLAIGLPDIFGGPGLMNVTVQDSWYDRDWMRVFILSKIHFDQQYFSAFITSLCMVMFNTSYQGIPLVYNTLRLIWKDQDIVLVRGNNTQTYAVDIFDSAKSQTVIYTPRYSAWSEYETIKRRVFQEDFTKLYILTCGPACKVLAYELHKQGRRALDLGHLAKDYDVYYGGRSRDRFWVD